MGFPVLEKSESMTFQMWAPFVWIKENMSCNLLICAELHGDKFDLIFFPLVMHVKKKIYVFQKRIRKTKRT